MIALRNTFTQASRKRPIWGGNNGAWARSPLHRFLRVSDASEIPESECLCGLRWGFRGGDYKARNVKHHQLQLLSRQRPEYSSGFAEYIALCRENKLHLKVWGMGAGHNDTFRTDKFSRVDLIITYKRERTPIHVWETGSRNLVWIWTHRFTNWLRLKAWSLWP